MLTFKRSITSSTDTVKVRIEKDGKLIVKKLYPFMTRVKVKNLESGSYLVTVGTAWPFSSKLVYKSKPVTIENTNENQTFKIIWNKDIPAAKRHFHKDDFYQLKPEEQIVSADQSTEK